MSTLIALLSTALVITVLATGYSLWSAVYRPRPIPELPAVRTGER